MRYIIPLGFFGILVLIDGLFRRLGFRAVLWCLGAIAFGPFCIPLYLAKRPLKIGETRKGGSGWIYLKFFSLFWTVYVINWAAIILYHFHLDRPEPVLFEVFTLWLFWVIWLLPAITALIMGLIFRNKSLVEKGPTD